MARAFIRRWKTASGEPRRRVVFKVCTLDKKWFQVPAPDDIQQLLRTSETAALVKAETTRQDLQALVKRHQHIPTPESTAALALHDLPPQLRTELENGVALTPDRNSIAAAVHDFLAARVDLATGTLDNYRRYLELFLDWSDNHLPQGRATHVLTALQPTHLQEWQTHRATEIKKSPNASHGRRALLSGIQALAALEKWLHGRGIVQNRIVRTTLDKPRQPKKTRDIFTEDRIRALLAAAAKHRRVPRRALPWDLTLRLLIETGIRQGEFLHLQWQDIELTDPEAARLKIQPKLYWNPKSYEQRDIPLTADLARLLTAHRDRYNLRPIDHLYNATETPPVCRDIARDTLAAIYKDAGIPFTGVHNLRHIACVRFMKVGIDLPVVKRLMGHADLQTTIRIYGDHVQGDQWLEEARGKLPRI